MMTLRNWSLCLLSLALFLANPLIAAEEHDHNTVESISETAHSDERPDEHKDEHGHDEENRVHLNNEQRQTAGIIVEALVSRPVPVEIEAPGEIRLNDYATSQVTPRIEAQIVKRHAYLGNHVKQGEPLVTLSSVSMAEAQGALLVAAKEWQRVKKLGKSVVSAKRHMETQVAYQQAKAKLLAYGMTAKQTNKLISENNISQADGSFSLLSPQDGTIIQDSFINGQMVEPGELLFELTDESRLWVEVRIKPESATHIEIGAPARLLVGETWIDGKVIQEHHALNEITRTLAVRLEIANPEHRLHPGQFATVRIQTDDSGKTALTLPQDAVLRSPDGDWQVFVEEEPGEYAPIEVTLVRQLPGLAVIDGLAPGTRVVTQGAFFVQSELAKSGFEVHNH